MNPVNSVHTPAEVYETQFVPALFRQWGPIVCAAAQIRKGDKVLDVACGTGVLACSAADLVGLQGSVVGLDPNADMLAVARSKSTKIEWAEGKAESMPFADDSFDAVVSQFGLMFFDDRPGAFREMMRVLRSGGRLAVAVCDAVEHSPGYSTLAELLQKLFGDDIANAFRAPFVLGNSRRLQSICAEAGIMDAAVQQKVGTVRFSSIESLISTERACVWTLGGLLNETQFAALLNEAERRLKPFANHDGAVTFDMPALIVTARKQ